MTIETDTAATELDPRPGWATAHGLIALRGPETTPDVSGPDRAMDRSLAAETVSRFAFAYDEQDEAALADCFTADAVLSATTAGTRSFGVYSGRDEVVGWLTAYWGRTTDQRRHLVTNAVVDDLDATSATVTTMLLVTAAENGAFRPVTAGLYTARVRKEADGAWRMSGFDLGFDASF